MRLSMDNLSNILINGENSFVEFKEKDVRSESVAKELVAFLNFEGGTLFIGVSDNGEIIGVDDKNYEEWIMNICRNSIYPPVIPIYEEIVIDDKKIIKVEVLKGINNPYHTSNKYYIRVGSTSREASQQELIRLLQSSNALHYEVIPMNGATVSDISKIRVEDYFAKRGIDISEYNKEEFNNLLYNTEILVSSTNEKYISLAGMLFFAKNQALWLKNSGVQLVRFSGNDVTSEIIDRKNLEGNLPDIIDKTLDFVNINNRVSERFEGIKRIDIYEYNKNVLREIIVNAFAHRDWSLIGAKIRVYVFEDFIEVRSPGKIPDTLTLERMKMGISYYRNPLIMQMLVDYGYADKIGRGIMSIIKYHEKNNLTPPEFIEEGFEFRVKIFKC